MVKNESLGGEDDERLPFEVAQNSVRAYDYAYETFKDDGSPEAELILQILTEYAAARLGSLPAGEREQLLSRATHLSPERIDANMRSSEPNQGQ